MRKAIHQVEINILEASFPSDILPTDTGLIIADGYGGVIARAAPKHCVAAAIRRRETLRFARHAAKRLSRLLDPPP